MSDSEYSCMSESEEEIIFESEEETIFKMNDIDCGGVESIVNDLDDEWNNFKKDYKNMSRDELLEHIKNDKLKKRKYIQKYQQTDKGRKKTREASKKYYNANRAKILEKKRLAYLAKKKDKVVSV